MIEIRLTKELGDYEPKLIGPFTSRQIICIIIAAPFCFLIYHFTAKVLPIDVAGFLIAIPGLIAALFGWCKPYGMKTEKFLKSIAVNVLLAPMNRAYKTKNAHESVIKVLTSAEEPEASEKEASATQQNKKEKVVIPECYF